ncbi:MAG: hypothetical protein U0931_35800 [Vulcanimicrobiota bacterium]
MIRSVDSVDRQEAIEQARAAAQVAQQTQAAPATAAPDETSNSTLAQQAQAAATEAADLSSASSQLNQQWTAVVSSDPPTAPPKAETHEIKTGAPSEPAPTTQPAAPVRTVLIPTDAYEGVSAADKTSLTDGTYAGAQAQYQTYMQGAVRTVQVELENGTRTDQIPLEGGELESYRAGFRADNGLTTEQLQRLQGVQQQVDQNQAILDEVARQKKAADTFASASYGLSQRDQEVQANPASAEALTRFRQTTMSEADEAILLRGGARGAGNLKIQRQKIEAFVDPVTGLTGKDLYHLDRSLSEQARGDAASAKLDSLKVGSFTSDDKVESIKASDYFKVIGRDEREALLAEGNSTLGKAYVLNATGQVILPDEHETGVYFISKATIGQLKSRGVIDEANGGLNIDGLYLDGGNAVIGTSRPDGGLVGSALNGLSHILPGGALGSMLADSISDTVEFVSRPILDTTRALGDEHGLVAQATDLANVTVDVAAHARETGNETFTELARRSADDAEVLQLTNTVGNALITTGIAAGIGAALVVSSGAVLAGQAQLAGQQADANASISQALTAYTLSTIMSGTGQGAGTTAAELGSGAASTAANQGLNGAIANAGLGSATSFVSGAASSAINQAATTGEVNLRDALVSGALAWAGANSRIGNTGINGVQLVQLARSAADGNLNAVASNLISMAASARRAENNSNPAADPEGNNSQSEIQPAAPEAASGPAPTSSSPGTSTDSPVWRTPDASDRLNQSQNSTTIVRPDGTTVIIGQDGTQRVVQTDGMVIETRNDSNMLTISGATRAQAFAAAQERGAGFFELNGTVYNTATRDEIAAAVRSQISANPAQFAGLDPEAEAAARQALANSEFNARSVDALRRINQNLANVPGVDLATRQAGIEAAGAAARATMAYRDEGMNPAAPVAPTPMPDSGLFDEAGGENAPALSPFVAAAVERFQAQQREVAARFQLAVGAMMSGEAPQQPFDPLREAVAVNRAIQPGLTGLGTNESALFPALNGRTPDQIRVMADRYREFYGQDMATAIRGDLSGSDLVRANHLLNGEQAAADAVAASQGIRVLGHTFFAAAPASAESVWARLAESSSAPPQTLEEATQRALATTASQRGGSANTIGRLVLDQFSDSGATLDRNTSRIESSRQQYDQLMAAGRTQEAAAEARRLNELLQFQGYALGSYSQARDAGANGIGSLAATGAGILAVGLTSGAALPVVLSSAAAAGSGARILTSGAIQGENYTFSMAARDLVLGGIDGGTGIVGAGNGARVFLNGSLEGTQLAARQGLVSSGADLGTLAGQRQLIQASGDLLEQQGGQFLRDQAIQTARAGALAGGLSGGAEAALHGSTWENGVLDGLARVGSQAGAGALVGGLTAGVASQIGARGQFAAEVEAYRTGANLELLSPAQQLQFASLAREAGTEAGSDLVGLLRNGTLDQPGLLDNLSGLTTQPMASGLSNQGVTQDVLQALNRPGAIILQDSKGTCTVTTLEHLLANTDPSEYARLVGGLTSEAGTVTLRNGEILLRNPTGLAADGTIRNDASRVLQSSLMDLGSAGNYHNGLDLVTRTSNSAGGLLPQEYLQVFQAVLGGQWEARGVAGAADRTAFEQAVAQGTPVPVDLRWATGGQDANHMLSVTRMDDNYVYLRNPHGVQETGALRSGDQLLIDRQVLSNQGDIAIRTQDFYNNLNGYLVQTSPDMLSYYRNQLNNLSRDGFSIPGLTAEQSANFQVVLQQQNQAIVQALESGLSPITVAERFGLTQWLPQRPVNAQLNNRRNGTSLDLVPDFELP